MTTNAQDVMAGTARIAVAGALGFVLASCGPSDGPAVEVHYLGHAAFLLEFPTGLTVLTDYGESRAYGLDSPVFEVGAVRPDVVTRSHDHPDHAGGELPEGIGVILTRSDSFTAKGVSITPIPTFENTLDTPDNVSFLLEYADLKILHLGDCQALILHASEPGMPERIRQLYPDTYDLVFLPIGFVQDILAEAAEFVTHVDTRRVVPMHYWQPADRDSFLERMRDRTDARGANYQARALQGASFRLTTEGRRDDVIEVLGLTPGPIPLPAGPYLGEPLPRRVPTLFAPGIVSTMQWEHSAPAFSPSGDEVLWTEISDSARIRIATLAEGRWQPARVAPWSGSFPDFYPAVTADGRRVFFASYRPWQEGTENPGYGITIWHVDRTRTGWGDPTRVGETVSTGNEFGFSLTADGTLYFTRAAGESFKIYRAESDSHGYAEPVLLPPEINAAEHQDGPYVTPDDRVLLFESIQTDGFGGADLYVSMRDPTGAWSPAVNLGPVINTPGAERFGRISNDRRFLFFGSDRNGDRGDIFWIPVDAVDPLRSALRSQW